MSDSFTTAGCVLALFVASLALPCGLSILWNRYHPRKPSGIHSSSKASAWAETRFPIEFRPIAAFVADILCAQLGVGLAQLEPNTSFIGDLKMDDLEPVEVVMAIEEDLGLEIPDRDCARMLNISELVRYLHVRLQSSSSEQMA